MKTLVMKNVTLFLFVCACIMSAQVAEAKCCGQSDAKEAPKPTIEVPKPTVVERIKNKISRMLNKNNEIIEEVEEAEETVKTGECCPQDGQCPVNEEDTENKDRVVKPEVETEEAEEIIHTLSATEVIETISAIIAEEVEAAQNSGTHAESESRISAR